LRGPKDLGIEILRAIAVIPGKPNSMHLRRVRKPSVNASRAAFVAGVDDLVEAGARYPDWLGRLLTGPVQGLANYTEMLRLPPEAKDAIKVYVEVDGWGKAAGVWRSGWGPKETTVWTQRS
jgi:hypothetical protein